MFAEHAESGEYDTTARTTVFHFDRGLDVPAVNEEIQAMVDFLCEGIADLVFG